MAADGSVSRYIRPELLAGTAERERSIIDRAGRSHVVPRVNVRITFARIATSAVSWLRRASRNFPTRRRGARAVIC